MNSAFQQVCNRVAVNDTEKMIARVNNRTEGILASKWHPGHYYSTVREFVIDYISN